MLNLFFLFIDDEEDAWPTDLMNPADRSKHIPQSYSTNSDTKIRNSSRKKTESSLYHMAAMMAGVGSGFDIRISNSTAIHPNSHPPSETDRQKKRDSYIGTRRDAYCAAVRDSFIEPEVDLKHYNHTSLAGPRHHTYHGQQSRNRPSIANMDHLQIPIQFKEQNDDNSTHTTSTLLSQQQTPTGEQQDALISFSPVNNSTFFGLQRQISDGSMSESTASVSTVKRFSVTFEDEIKPDYLDRNYHQQKTSTPNTSNTSPSQAIVPPRRSLNGDTPERPNILDTGPRARPVYSSILKNSNSSTPSTRESPKPWVTPSENPDSTPYYSTRSRLSPGNTPPHISHRKTLLDIDVEGQSKDETRPLLKHKPSNLPYTVKEFEDFLH